MEWTGITNSEMLTSMNLVILQEKKNVQLLKIEGEYIESKSNLIDKKVYHGSEKQCINTNKMGELMWHHAICVAWVGIRASMISF